MSWQVLRTEKFNDQLYDLLHYISGDSGSVDVALNVLNRLENAVTLLSTAPNMGARPRYSTLRRQGYRVLIVEKHLLFYKTDDAQKRVILYAIVDSRQEYRNLL
jgi:toxin ParE1/3/4